MAAVSEKTLLDEEQIARTLRRIAHEIVEREGDDLERAVLVGLYTRGVPLASRLRRQIAEIAGVELPVGAVDITFYRDDVGLGREARAHPQPVVKASSLPGSLDDRVVIVVDDVLSTGRTARAAIEALFDYGRPARVRLAVLCDRGHRELPIRADYVGKNLPTARAEWVTVRLVEVDEVDDVLLEKGGRSEEHTSELQSP